MVQKEAGQRVGLTHQSDASALVSTIINNLDELGIKELVQGNESDVNRVIDVLHEEALSVVNNGARMIKSPYSNLDRLSESVEETFRSKSFSYFVSAVLPNFDMNWHVLEWMNLCQLYRRLCVLASRGHSKSFTFSFALPLWQMYRYRASVAPYYHPVDIQMAKQGLLITNEQKLASSLLSLVRVEIEQNDILRERLYPMPGSKKRWGDQHIECKNGSSFLVRSATGKIRGLHPTYKIMDDFLNESSLYSEEQRQKYLEIFNGSVMPAGDPNGPTYIVGTPFYEKDLYHVIEQDGLENPTPDSFRVFRYPAIDANGQLLYAKRWNWERLMAQKRLMGNLVFSREYMVNPLTEDATIFPWDILNKAIYGMTSVDVCKSIETYYRRFSQVVVGCDFAISGGIGADYSVFVVLGVDEFGVIHVLNYWRKRGASYSEQIAVLKRMNQDFRPDVFVVEKNGMQAIFEQELITAGLPVVGKTTDNNKKSLYEGVPSLAVLFETYRIRFPYGTTAAKNMFHLFGSELNSISFIQEKGKLEGIGQHDDSAMALWQGCRYIRRAEDFEFLVG